MKGGQKAVITGWKSLAEKHPEQFCFVQCLATAYEQSGGSNAVVKGFKELVAKYPNRRYYRLELANAYERKEDIASAFRAWKHVLEMNPGDANAEVHLINAYLYLMKHHEVSYCGCIGVRIEVADGSRYMRFCPKCDQYLENLSVSVLRSIKERGAEVISEGTVEAREEVERLDRMLVYSGFV